MTSPATPLPNCPWCGPKAPLQLENSALPMAHCGTCGATVLPSASTVAVFTNHLGVPLPALQELVAAASGKSMPCAVCSAAVSPTTIKGRPVSICRACGASMFAPGVLWAMSAGRVGKPIPAPASPPTSTAPGVRLDSAISLDAPLPSWRRWLSAWSGYWVDGKAKKYFATLSGLLTFVVVMMLMPKPHKPKIGVDGLPGGNLGMHPESARMFRQVTGGGGALDIPQPQLPGAEQRLDPKCPPPAKPLWEDHGWRCMDGKVPHGPFEEDTCDENGTGGSKVGAYDQGKEQGAFKNRDCQGNLSMEANYEAGVFHGVVVDYAAPGQPLKSANYDHGKLHGAYREFHPNGQVAVDGFHHHGEKTGHWTWTSPAGRVVREEQF